MVMADAEAESAKRKGKDLAEEQNKAKRDTDRAQEKTQSNLIGHSTDGDSCGI